MQTEKQRDALSCPVQVRDWGTPNTPASSLPWAMGTQEMPWSPAHAIRVCTGASWRNWLRFPSDAYNPLLTSAACSESLSLPLLLQAHPHVHCLPAPSSALHAVSIAVPWPQEMHCGQAGLASAWGAASRSHAGMKALPGKHL